MAQASWPDVAVGGGIVIGINAILYSLRYFWPKNAKPEKPQTLREYFSEIRDDKLLENMRQLKETNERLAGDHSRALNEQTDLLREVRDIMLRLELQNGGRRT